MWCWGTNASGQIGDGTTNWPKPSPTQVKALGASAVAVSGGGYHTCALKNDGTVWCWGDNTYGQLGQGTINPFIPLPIQVAALGASVVEVSAGSWFTCARKADGTLWCWGYDLEGELGTGTNGIPYPLPVQVAALGVSVVGVVADNDHTCARKNDGTLWCWGLDTHGQLGQGMVSGAAPSPLQVTALGTNVSSVVAGGQHTCATKNDGTLWCWGGNEAGQLGDGTTVTPVPSPVQVAALGAAVAKAASGYAHSCATKNDGTLWCWGDDEFGELGVGTTCGPPFPCGEPSPVQVIALGASVVEASLGSGHSCARKGDGTVWCWGQNNWGQTGDGTTVTPRPSPVQVLLPCP